MSVDTDRNATRARGVDVLPEAKEPRARWRVGRLVQPPGAPVNADTTDGRPIGHAEQPSAQHATAALEDAAEALIRSLKQEVRQLAEELDAVRARAGAERMHLLEQLAAARDARHQAETELAGIRAVLDTAERQLPGPRRGELTGSANAA